MDGTVDVNEISVFVGVVKAGSFSAGARRLNMPKSTVSRRISQLEARLGVRLLHRTTRKFALTDSGHAYFERVAPAIAELNDAEAAVASLHTEPSGVLRISAPLAMRSIGALVAEYLIRYPDVQVDVVCTDRPVDLIEERFDLAIRIGPLADSTMIARKIGVGRGRMVASPGYCDQYGEPASPAELRAHRCVNFGVGSTPRIWALEAKGERVEVEVSPRLTVNDLDVLRAAALGGVGIALLPNHLCADELKAGRLRRLLPQWSPPDVPVHVVYPTRRQLSPKVIAFIDLIPDPMDL